MQQKDTEEDKITNYLDEKDWAILYCKLKNPSVTDDDIGLEIGLDRRTVNKRRNTAKFQNALKQAYAEPCSILKSTVTEAARVFISLLKCEDVRVQEKVARAILFSCGALQKEFDTKLNQKIEPIIIEMSGGKKIIMGPKHDLEEMSEEELDSLK